VLGEHTVGFRQQLLQQEACRCVTHLGGGGPESQFLEAERAGLTEVLPPGQPCSPVPGWTESLGSVARCWSFA
jgi:hypothetical protein